MRVLASIIDTRPHRKLSSGTLDGRDEARAKCEVPLLRKVTPVTEPGDDDPP